MIEEFYDYGGLNDAIPCERYVREIAGEEVVNGRCRAFWRGGEDFNVSLDGCKFYDHVEKAGGDVIKMCAFDKFKGEGLDAIQAAQQMLGRWAGLVPAMVRKAAPMVSTRYDELIADGYTETTRYGYFDLEGNLVHFVARFEHPEKAKEFMQGTPNHWGLRDVTPILYRMNTWLHHETVAIVEGEKDADTVIDRLGIPATTNCGGSKKWRSEYNELFADKRVCIIADNDDSGKAHADRVSRELKDHAAEIRIVTPSKLPRGDVTDWVEKEGGTREALIEMIKHSFPLALDRLEDINPLLEAAKEANKWDMQNFRMEKKQVGNQIKNVKVPRRMVDIIADVHKRFVGFPRKVGDAKAMFDHDHDTGEIVPIENTAALFAWMQRKCKRKIDWAKGEGFVEKTELFYGLHAEAQRYESISTIPDWPKRPEVYYAHDEVPEATPDRQYFKQFLDFFEPATEEDRTLLAAFICAPLWYVQGLPRPMWTIDSTDGAGNGKSTLVEMVAKLYKSPPIRVNLKELKTKVEDITKRVVSTSGRLARFFMVDNATGIIAVPELADMVTAESISGKAPYGRGEESRPNNLTFVVTSNSAQLDNDLSDRSLFIYVKKPKRNPMWKRDVMAYIEKHRMQIFADMIATLETGPKLSEDPKTRFPEFEETILRAVCDGEPEYHAAIATVIENRATSNTEEEAAQIIEEGIREKMLQIEGNSVDPNRQNIFIVGAIFNNWVKWIAERDLPGKVTGQDVRTYSKNGHTKFLTHKPDRIRLQSGSQPRGFLWQADHESQNINLVIEKDSGGKPMACLVNIGTGLETPNPRAACAA